MAYTPIFPDLPLKSVLTPDHLAHIENGILGAHDGAREYVDEIAAQIQAGQVTDPAFDAAVNRAAADGRLVVEGVGGEAPGVEITETLPGAYQFVSGETSATLYGLTSEQKLPAAAKSDLRTEFATTATLDTTVAGNVNNATTTTHTAIKAVADATVAPVRTDLTPGNGKRPVGRDELFINVKDYGAKGDGVTNDTAAINAAFAALVPGSPGRVYFPPGQYTHRRIAVTGKSNFEVVGPGELVAQADIIETYLTFDNCTDFSVTGLRSRHANPTARRTATAARSFTFTNCTRFTVSKVHAHHCEGVGVMLLHCSYANIEGNQVYDTWADGIGLYGDTHHVTVTGNVIRETGDDGIAQVGVTAQGVQPHDNSITGNTVNRSHARGIVVVGAYNTTVAGNTIDVTRAGGLYVCSEPSRNTYGNSNVVISGNVVKDANTYEPTIEQAGIYVVGGTMSVDDITITNNRVINPRKEGIRLGGSATGTRRITLMGNSVKGAGSNGIAIWSVEDLTMIGNTFTDSGSYGVFATSGLTGSVILTGNTVRRPNTAGSTFAAYGLNSVTAAAVHMSGNTAIEAAGAVYGIDAPATATLFGNNLDGLPVRGGAQGTTQMFGNVSVSAAAATASTADGRGVIAVRNAGVVPTTNPSNGGVVYVEGGALKYRGSAGTVTTLGPA